MASTLIEDGLLSTLLKCSAHRSTSTLLLSIIRVVSSALKRRAVHELIGSCLNLICVLADPDVLHLTKPLLTLSLNLLRASFLAVDSGLLLYTR